MKLYKCTFDHVTKVGWLINCNCAREESGKWRMWNHCDQSEITSMELRIRTVVANCASLVTSAFLIARRLALRVNLLPSLGPCDKNERRARVPCCAIRNQEATWKRGKIVPLSRSASGNIARRRNVAACSREHCRGVNGTASRDAYAHMRFPIWLHFYGS